MWSMIREVLIPAAPALVLIGTLVIAPAAQGQESEAGEKITMGNVVILAAQMSAAGAAEAADGHRRGAGIDGAATATSDAQQCRRIDRIGKVKIRRCE